MRILITICARGGSKGVPGKNIKPLAGKPLLTYTIEVARKFAEKFASTDIALSTDSDEIKEVAARHGLTTGYSRPASLAGDTAGKVDAIADILHWQEKQLGIRYDYVLDMDVTSPLRSVKDLSAAFALIREDEKALTLFSVNPAGRNPYFNMVEQKENGYYDKVKSLGDVLARQAAPKVYDLNASFYFYRRSFFDQEHKSPITDRSLIYEVPHICFDIDHPIDFDILSYLVSNDKLDFQW